MNVRLLRLIGMTVFALCVLAGPAHAAADTADGSTDELGLSRDGVHWSESLTEPLFNPDFRWVPGDSQTERFYVRNQSHDNAELRVRVQGTGDEELLGDDDISMEVRAGGGEWFELRNGVDSKKLNDSVLHAGASMPVDVRATFDPASSNRSQVRAIDLRFVVTLNQSLNDDGGALPDTGAPRALWVSAIGAILVGAGLSLVIGRRRAKEDGYV